LDDGGLAGIINEVRKSIHATITREVTMSARVKQVDRERPPRASTGSEKGAIPIAGNTKEDRFVRRCTAVVPFRNEPPRSPEK
jgi:hypothetical protein